MAFLWFTLIPLGIPGEWVWDRPQAEPDLWWNLLGGLVAAGVFTGFVRQGWHRLGRFAGRRFQHLELTAWLLGLVAISFCWLWIVQEIAPARSRLGKSAFVLYYASSSGYYTRARQEPQPLALLSGYEELMRQGDVLHTGTHPPGLFLAFHGLIAACDSSPALTAFLDATQPYSFREAIDIIAANSLRRRFPQPLLPLDRRVLWLATLLVMSAASLTVIPLYGLLRRTSSMQTAWVGAALWPALPAVAIFVPKSDVMFPLMGLFMMWLWLTAWDRRSLILAVLAGAAAWTGLFCSLAFLPVLLVAALMTLGSSWLAGIGRDETTEKSLAVSGDATPIGMRHWMCLGAAGLGFSIPIFLLWRFAGINLLSVWWMNYRNHAGFYQQFTRTYWSWLLVNPLELAMSAGWPVTMLAVVTCVSVFRRKVPADPQRRRRVFGVVGSIVSVWGLLWLTGKNSGEAARLWILFLPWLVWLASIQLEDIGSLTSDFKLTERRTLLLLATQLVVCLLTVARVSGFHSESGSSG